VFLLIDAYNNYTPQGTKFQRVYIIGITLSVCLSVYLFICNSWPVCAISVTSLSIIRRVWECIHM